jgi:hypothetical protein
MTLESETYAMGFNVMNIAIPIIYCMIKYATAATIEILPLANGLFSFVLQDALLNAKYGGRLIGLTNTGVQLAVEYVIRSTSR